VDEGGGPPTVTILAPADGTSIRQGTPLELSGGGVDPEDGVLPPEALGWRSSIDGPLGTGSPVVRTDLSTGTHEIRLTGVDDDGNVSHTTVGLVVTPPNDPPTAAITEPADGSVVAFGVPLTLAGTGSDPEDGALSGDALTWSSDLDGPLGTGLSVVRGDLSPGAHTVTLTAEDSGGATGTASVGVVVDGPPSVTIAAPADGAVFADDATVTFQGDAVDAEDGSLPDDDLVWESSLNGSLGTGRELSRSDLSSGVHRIVLSAADALGSVSADTVTIQVEGPVNVPPTVTIRSPADGSTFFRGQLVGFSGVAEDAEDGRLPGSALTWTSSLDGDFATGVGATSGGLSPGVHEITLRAVDSEGAEGSDAVTITVLDNSAPTASISSPSDDETFLEGDAITFSGSGSDPEDGSLPGSSLRWTSSRDGFLGTGTSLVRSDLSVGSHTIELSVEDAQGAPGSTSVRITVQEAVSFRDDVLGALGSCTSCHFSGSGQPPDWWAAGSNPDLIYNQLLQAGQNGGSVARVIPGNTTRGDLICQITGNAAAESFPGSCNVNLSVNDMRVSSSTLSIILAWIAQGARNN
jgi:hypothetical protein